MCVSVFLSHFKINGYRNRKLPHKMYANVLPKCVHRRNVASSLLVHRNG